MKRFLFLFGIVFGLLFASCEKQQPIVIPTFEITVSDVTASTATVSVTPSDSSVWYYYDIIPVEYFNEYADADELAKDYLEWIEDEVEYYQEYGVDYVFEDWLSRGVDGYDFSDLTAETEYVAFAFAVDTSTHLNTGAFFQTHFTTLPVEETLLTFELANSDTALWFLPNSDEITYFADYVSVDTLSAYNITAAEFFEADVEYYGEYISYFTQKGAIYLPWSYLNPGDTYVFLARAYNAGEWNSDLFTTEFAVPALEPETVPARDRNLMKRSMRNTAKRVGKKLNRK